MKESPAADLSAGMLQILFVYVYGPAVKEGWISAWPYMPRCAHVRGARPYGPVFAHVGVEAQEGRMSERERESISFVFTADLHSPARATATPHPLYPQQMATRQLPADTRTLILCLNHTHTRKISFPTLSEMSWDLRCKMECLKHMIRNRQGSH